jgi:hypothetical protein
VAVEFEIRLHKPFTIAALQPGTEEALQEFLGVGLAEPVEVFASTQDYLEHQWSAERANASVLDATYGAGPVPYAVVLAVPGGGVEVSFHDHGSPEVPELGEWIVVSAGLERVPTAFVLGIASAVAIARLTDGAIVDDSFLLGGDRVQRAEEVVTRLRVVGEEVTASAIEALLHKTRMVGQA